MRCLKIYLSIQYLNNILHRTHFLVSLFSLIFNLSCKKRTVEMSKNVFEITRIKFKTYLHM